MPDHEKFWWRMSLLLVIVISAIAWYGCNQQRSGIYAGRVVKHEHEKESVKLRFDPALEILVPDYERIDQAFSGGRMPVRQMRVYPARESGRDGF